MKYTAKEIKENINISPTSPIKDFFELIAKILGILLLIYLLLGWIVDYIAPRMSLDLELKISRLFSGEFEKRVSSKTEEKIQIILDNLVLNADSLPKFEYKVRTRETKQINALALPGGHIVVFSALLKEIQSENELAMILGHELGHFVHRDHLRGMGRSLVFLILSTVTLGADSPVSKLFANSITNMEMRFSQAQERAADIYALDLLNKTYGNVAGALDFYEKMAKKERLGRFFYIFASHPYPKSRITAVEERIKIRDYKIEERIPINISDKMKE